MSLAAAQLGVEQRAVGAISPFPARRSGRPARRFHSIIASSKQQNHEQQNHEARQARTGRRYVATWAVGSP
jgi:hypothetical protein